MFEHTGNWQSDCSRYASCRLTYSMANVPHGKPHSPQIDLDRTNSRQTSSRLLGTFCFIAGHDEWWV
jgi:hypothetical protein